MDRSSDVSQKAEIFRLELEGKRAARASKFNLRRVADKFV